MNKVFYTICFFVVSNQILSQTQLGSDIDGDAGDALGYGHTSYDTNRNNLTALDRVVNSNIKTNNRPQPRK